MMPYEIPPILWKVIGTDLVCIAGETYLVVVNYHSKFLFIRKMHYACTSREVKRTLTFGEHGIPKHIISDDDP